MEKETSEAVMIFMFLLVSVSVCFTIPPLVIEVDFAFYIILFFFLLLLLKS